MKNANHLLIILIISCLILSCKKIEDGNEKVLNLKTDMIDAEYSKSKDILVYISSSPQKVNVYNTRIGSFKSFELDYVPTCISLSSDGETAAVGHDGHVTYISIIDLKVIRVYSVSCYAGDIVLGDNKWAYVLPKTGQWSYIRCINLNLTVDNEVLQTGNYVYEATNARLHPSGKYIYGATNHLYPSSIEKYDIQNGPAIFLYQDPYHVDYPFEGNLWYSKNGDRIFTCGTTVVHTSEIHEQDMIYNGTISLEGASPTGCSNIQWLDFSEINNSLYILYTGDSCTDYEINKPFVYVHDASNLVYRKKYELEKYIVKDNQGNDVFYDAEPFFVFSNSSGSTLFVITKAFSSGLEYEWAIQRIPLNQGYSSSR